MLAWMKEILDALLNVILMVLPLSPFTKIIASLEDFPFLGYLNWFLPISRFIEIGSVWLIAIGTYYLYSVIARWVKIIS